MSFADVLHYVKRNMYRKDEQNENIVTLATFFGNNFENADPKYLNLW